MDLRAHVRVNRDLIPAITAGVVAFNREILFHQARLLGLEPNGEVRHVELVQTKKSTHYLFLLEVAA